MILPEGLANRAPHDHMEAEVIAESIVQGIRDTHGLEVSVEMAVASLGSLGFCKVEGNGRPEEGYVGSFERNGVVVEVYDMCPLDDGQFDNYARLNIRGERYFGEFRLYDSSKREGIMVA